MYLAVAQGHGETWFNEFDDLESARHVIETWRARFLKNYPQYNFCFVIYKAEVSETCHSFP